MQNSFGSFLCQKRKEKNITQKELASQLFVSESAVSKWEKDIARPDMSLLSKLSQILGVTEHELITASIDEKSRNTELQAKKWRRLAFSWNLFFYIAYGITILTCFIVNLAVSKKLDWFWIVFASLLLSASFTTIPQYIHLSRIILIPLIEFVSLVILLGVCCLYTGGNWFWFSMLPVLCGVVIVFVPIIIYNTNLPKFIKQNNAIISVTLDYAILCLMLKVVCKSWFLPLAFPLISIGYVIAVINVICLRYVKANKLIKTGITTLCWSGIYLGIGYGLERILSRAGINTQGSTPFSPLKFNFAKWTGNYINYNVMFIILAVLVVLSVVFLALGIKKK